MATVDDAVQSQARNIEQAGRSTSLTSAASHPQTPRYWALTFSRDSDELAVARFRFESDEQLDLERRRQALPLTGLYNARSLTRSSNEAFNGGT